MPPPAPIAAALQRILDDVPNLDVKHLENTYTKTTHTLGYDGVELELEKGGLSRSKPTNMGYIIRLGALTNTTYSIWLLWPSDDVAINRRALALALEYLINEAGPATISHQVDVAALPL